MTEEVIGECLQSVRNGMSKISASNSKKILENLFMFKNSGTRYNEMPGDRHGVCYWVLFLRFYYYRAKEYRSLYWGLRYTGVRYTRIRYIGVPL